MGRRPCVLLALALLAGCLGDPAEPDATRLPQVPPSTGEPGPYLEDAAEIAKLRGFLRASAGHAIACGHGQEAPASVPAIANDTNLADAMGTWFLSCLGPHLARAPDDPHPVDAEFEAALRNGTERQVFLKYHNATGAVLSRLLGIFDAEEPGSVVDAEVRAIAMRRVMGLVRFHERNLPALDLYEQGLSSPQALRSAANGEFYTAMDAHGILDFLLGYPLADGRCSFEPEEPAVLEARLLQAIRTGQELDAGLDHGDPLGQLQRRDYALLNASAERGWPEGLLAVEMILDHRTTAWEYHGEEVGLGPATDIANHAMATNRSLMLEEFRAQLGGLIEDPAYFAQNPSAGPQFVALHGLRNPFLDASCGPAEP